MKNILLVFILCFVGCTTIQKPEIIHCMEKPEPKTLVCLPECGFTIVSNDGLVRHECTLCTEDLYNLLVYFKEINKYSSNDCLSIKIKE